MKLKMVLMALYLTVQASYCFSQQDDSLNVQTVDTVRERQHIAIFAPLYLDSAFDAGGNYRYARSFPKFINPGLEFWEGAQLAIDSLKKEGVKVDVHVYDTRSTKKPFASLVADPELKQMDLLIGHVNVNEAASLAWLANNQGIPFINANLPNEAGVSNNPQYVILNSTLYTHCSGIYRFLQTNYSVSNIIVFRKKGATEDRLKDYLTQIENNTAAIKLKIKYVTLENNFTIQQLQPYLDSNKTNVCLAGSLDAAFGQSLCQLLSSVSSSYTSTVFGMPTWDVLDFEKPMYKGIEIFYSTPFYINPADKLVAHLNDYFRIQYYSRPSDMVFRGYETLYHFARLLNEHKQNISSSLGDKKYKIFTEMDVQPVLDKKDMTLDYFENKKLYFVKKVDGQVKAVY